MWWIVAAQLLWILICDLPFSGVGTPLVRSHLDREVWMRCLFVPVYVSAEEGKRCHRPFQSTQLQLLFKNCQWVHRSALLQLLDSEAQAPMLSLQWIALLSAPALRRCHCHWGWWRRCLGTQQQALVLELLTLLSETVVFLLLVHLHKGQHFELEIFWLLNFWTG